MGQQCMHLKYYEKNVDGRVKMLYREQLDKIAFRFIKSLIIIYRIIIGKNATQGNLKFRDAL